MLSYVTVGSNHLDRAVPYFTELLGTQGVTKLFDHPRGGALFGKEGKIVLAVLKPFDGNPASVGNGGGTRCDLRARLRTGAASVLRTAGTGQGAGDDSVFHCDAPGLLRRM